MGYLPSVVGEAYTQGGGIPRVYREEEGLSAHRFLPSLRRRRASLRRVLSLSLRRRRASLRRVLFSSFKEAEGLSAQSLFSFPKEAEGLSAQSLLLSSKGSGGPLCAEVSSLLLREAEGFSARSSLYPP